MKTNSGTTSRKRRHSVLASTAIFGLSVSSIVAGVLGASPANAADVNGGDYTSFVTITSESLPSYQPPGTADTDAPMPTPVSDGGNLLNRSDGAVKISVGITLPDDATGGDTITLCTPVINDSRYLRLSTATDLPLLAPDGTQLGSYTSTAGCGVLTFSDAASEYTGVTANLELAAQNGGPVDVDGNINFWNVPLQVFDPAGNDLADHTDLANTYNLRGTRGMCSTSGRLHIACTTANGVTTDNDLTLSMTGVAVSKYTVDGTGKPVITDAIKPETIQWVFTDVTSGAHAICASDIPVAIRTTAVNSTGDAVMGDLTGKHANVTCSEDGSVMTVTLPDGLPAVGSITEAGDMVTGFRLTAVFIADTPNYMFNFGGDISAQFASGASVSREETAAVQSLQLAGSADGVAIPPVLNSNKVALDAGPFVVGQTINYAISVTNSSKYITARGVVVTDTPTTGLEFVSADSGGTWADGKITWAVGDLAGGESVSLRAQFKVTSAATDNLENRLSVSGENACDEDDTKSVCEGEVEVPVAKPGLSLEKSHADVVDANGNGVVDAGDTVVFQFTGQNTGNIPATDVTVTDEILAAAGVALQNGGIVGTLAPGATYTLVSDPYTLTLADVDAGGFHNMAVVRGNTPAGPTDDEDDDDVPVERTALVTIEKSHTEVVDANENGKSDAGDTVTFLFTGANTGITTLTDVTVTDPILADLGVKLVNDGKVGELTPGMQYMIDSEPYTLTQADVDAGIFYNVATVTAQSPIGEVTSDNDDTVIPDQDKLITITKSHVKVVDVNENKLVDAGDTVVFTMTGANEGTTTLTDVVVVDETLAALGVKLANDGKVGELTPGMQYMIDSEPYTLTQADADAGVFHNTATVTGTSPVGPVSATDDDEVKLDQVPLITIAKSHSAVVDVNGNKLVDAGDTTIFTFEGENTGTVTMTDVVVTDEALAKAGVALENDGVVGTLAPGEKYTVRSAPYTLTQGDVDRGFFLNVATVVGNTPAGPGTDDDDDKVDIDRTKGVTIVKSHAEVVDVNDNGYDDAGDIVVFSFTGTNPGTTTLTDVTVTDPILEAAGVKLENGGVVGVLAPGASYLVKSEPYTLTQEDTDNGLFANVGYVEGTSPIGPVKASSDDEVPTDQVDGLAFVKSHQAVVDVDKDRRVSAGDTVVFTFAVENTGTTTLSDIVVTDKILADLGVKLENDGKIGDLAPGETGQVLSKQYTITEADVTAGAFHNVATVTADTPQGGVTEEDDDTVKVDSPLPRANTGNTLQEGSPIGLLALGGAGVLALAAVAAAVILIRQRRKVSAGSADLS